MIHHIPVTWLRSTLDCRRLNETEMWWVVQTGYLPPREAEERCQLISVVPSRKRQSCAFSTSIRSSVSTDSNEPSASSSVSLSSFKTYFRTHCYNMNQTRGRSSEKYLTVTVTMAFPFFQLHGRFLLMCTTLLMTSGAVKAARWSVRQFPLSTI